MKTFSKEFMAHALETRGAVPLLSSDNLSRSCPERLLEKTISSSVITFNYPHLSVTDRGIVREAIHLFSEDQTDIPRRRIILVDELLDTTSIPQAHEDFNREMDWIVRDVVGIPNNTYERVIARAFTDFLTHGDLVGALPVYNPHKNTKVDIYEHFGPLLQAKIFSLLSVATKRDSQDKALDNSIRCALQGVEYLKQSGLVETAGKVEARLKREYFKANFWKDLTPFSASFHQNGHSEQNGHFRLPSWIRVYSS